MNWWKDCYAATFGDAQVWLQLTFNFWVSLSNFGAEEKGTTDVPNIDRFAQGSCISTHLKM